MLVAKLGRIRYDAIPDANMHALQLYVRHPGWPNIAVLAGKDRDRDIGLFVDLWDGDVDWGMTSEKKLWAVWTYSKRAVLYKDKDMTEQIGWLDITGSGTWCVTAWWRTPEMTCHFRLQHATCER